MDDGAVLSSDLVHVGTGPEDQFARSKLIGLINHLPNLLDAARKLAPTDTFRVVMSAQNADLFRPGPNGTWSTMLRQGNRIRENAQLEKVGPDFLTAAPNIVLYVSMRAIAQQLASIEAKVDQLGNILTYTQQGRLCGTLQTLHTARFMSLASERRQGMLSACAAVQIELLATTGLLKAHIAAMPEERTGFMDGIFGTGFAKAARAFEPVREDMQAIARGTGALLEAFAELDEPEAAKEALAQIVSAIDCAGLKDAIRKVRLLPTAPGSAPPEADLISLSKAIASINRRLIAADTAMEAAVCLELQPVELQLA